MSTEHKSTIVLYNKCMFCISCHFRPLKPLKLRMDHSKLLDVLTSLPVSYAILPRAVCFATSHLANHAICSYMYSSRYASGPIRRCLFIDIIKLINAYLILSHIWDAICRDSLKSAYAISSFPPTGYQPAVVITGSHVF